MSRTSALGQFTLLPVLADAADITEAGTTMADRIEKYVNLRFASAAARDAVVTSPEEAMCAYIGSNDSAEGPYWYNSTSWRLPWNMPWGFVGQTTSNAVTAGIGAVQDLVTVTFTAIANRRYRLNAYCAAVTTVAVTNFNLFITDNTPTTLQQCNLSNTSAANAANITGFCQINVSPGAGSVTYRARISATGGTLTLLGGQMTHYLLVEDIGPNGAPT